ncbi:hypothetical protein BB560_002493 [Smittium megazygosporum]|uniref:Uncharacterized protein n=1 Tax=Smittium megazygosporum TaxID=133381 RepID=A0A2T9ZER2_9FUNG|nr:hypothetical protein BB560_002493 [Smittium megazygosporum]
MLPNDSRLVTIANQLIKSSEQIFASLDFAKFYYIQQSQLSQQRISPPIEYRSSEVNNGLDSNSSSINLVSQSSFTTAQEDSQSLIFEIGSSIPSNSQFESSYNRTEGKHHNSKEFLGQNFESRNTNEQNTRRVHISNISTENKDSKVSFEENILESTPVSNAIDNRNVNKDPLLNDSGGIHTKPNTKISNNANNPRDTSNSNFFSSKFSDSLELSSQCNAEIYDMLKTEGQELVSELYDLISTKTSAPFTTNFDSQSKAFIPIPSNRTSNSDLQRISEITLRLISWFRQCLAAIQIPTPNYDPKLTHSHVASNSKDQSSQENEFMDPKKLSRDVENTALDTPASDISPNSLDPVKNLENLVFLKPMFDKLVSALNDINQLSPLKNPPPEANAHEFDTEKKLNPQVFSNANQTEPLAFHTPTQLPISIKTQPLTKNVNQNQEIKTVSGLDLYGLQNIRPDTNLPNPTLKTGSMSQKPQKNPQRNISASAQGQGSLDYSLNSRTEVQTSRDSTERDRSVSNTHGFPLNPSNSSQLEHSQPMGRNKSQISTATSPFLNDQSPTNILDTESNSQVNYFSSNNQNTQNRNLDDLDNIAEAIKKTILVSAEFTHELKSTLSSEKLDISSHKPLESNSEKLTHKDDNKQNIVLEERFNSSLVSNSIYYLNIFNTTCEKLSDALQTVLANKIPDLDSNPNSSISSDTSIIDKEIDSNPSSHGRLNDANDNAKTDIQNQLSFCVQETVESFVVLSKYILKNNILQNSGNHLIDTYKNLVHTTKELGRLFV